MDKPSNKKDIMKLTGMMAALVVSLASSVKKDYPSSSY
jgi:hypothetical protein